MKHKTLDASINLLIGYVGQLTDRGRVSRQAKGVNAEQG